jgi:hypothetical protein
MNERDKILVNRVKPPCHLGLSFLFGEGCFRVEEKVRSMKCMDGFPGIIEPITMVGNEGFIRGQLDMSLLQGVLPLILVRSH